MISEAERNFINYLDSLYREGAMVRERLQENWDRAVKFLASKMWPEKKPKYKVEAVLNFLYQVVERKTALLTDSKPTITVTSRHIGGRLDPVCEVLQKTVEAIFSEHHWDQKLTELIFMEQAFGICATNTCYDRSLDWGRGDIDIVVLDPRTFVFDPFVTRSYDLNSGEYFCLETVRPTSYLKEKYRNRADDIKADYNTETSTSPFAKLRKLFANMTEFRTGTEAASVVPRSIVREYWIKDRTTRTSSGDLAYPNWREVVVAGGCIVEDGANPYIDGNIPIDLLDWDFNIDSAYGFNEVGKLESPQLLLNKIIASIVDNVILMGNAIWIGDANALTNEQWDRLSNAPGEHVKVRPGAALRREPGVPLPPYITQVVSFLLGSLEKLSSITEVMEGRRPGQLTSGVAIEALQLAASTAIRLKARQIENLIQRVGQKLIWRIFQYYTDDRVFTLVGDGQRFERFTYVRDIIRQALEKEGLSITSAFKDFVLTVVPASSLALTNWQKGLIAMQLYQAGAIDREALLEAVNYPNREEILARTLEKQQSGEEPAGVRKPQKLPRSVLRGGHQETGFQLPQMGAGGR